MSRRQRRPPLEYEWELAMGYLEWRNAKWKIKLPDGRELHFDPDQRTRDVFAERRYEPGFIEAVAALSLEPEFTLQRALELPPNYPLIDGVLGALRQSVGIDAPLVHLGPMTNGLPRGKHAFTLMTRADDGTRVDSDTGDFFYEDKAWRLDVYAPVRLRLEVRCHREFPGARDEPWIWTVAVHHESATRVEPLLDAFRALGHSPAGVVTNLP
ncbi:MAG: hypothetical protein QM817_08680 [Archangium sp.]